MPRHELLIALDDADGRILYGRFFPQEAVASTFPALEAAVHTTAAFWSCTPTAAATSAAPSRPDEDPPPNSMVK